MVGKKRFSQETINNNKKEYLRRYYLENKDKINEQNNIRNEKRKEYFKQYQAENADLISQKKREYYQKKKDEKKLYYEQNKDRILDQYRIKKLQQKLIVSI